MQFNQYPKFRSLLYFLSHPNDLYINESGFKKFSLLKVLNLENYNGNLPKDIGHLIHLRFLSLKGSNLKNMPSSMDNLRCLQTLDLWSHSNGVRVPNVFKKNETTEAFISTHIL